MSLVVYLKYKRHEYHATSGCALCNCYVRFDSSNSLGYRISGTVTTNRLPRPTSEETSMDPFNSSTKRLVIARPRPVPLMSSEGAIRLNSSNIESKCSGGIPLPESSTAICQSP